jgi:ABC-type sulfate transport system permease component
LAGSHATRNASPLRRSRQRFIALSSSPPLLLLLLLLLPLLLLLLQLQSLQLKENVSDCQCSAYSV